MKRLTKEEANFVKNSQKKYSLIIQEFQERFNRIIPKSVISYYKTKGLTPDQRRDRHSKLSKLSSGNWKHHPPRIRIQHIKIPKNCLYCGKPCNKHFCNNRECIENYRINQYVHNLAKGHVDGMRGKGAISSYLRRYLFRQNNNSCQECGWSKKNPATNKYPLEVHHIDGNYKNNTITNLQLLCPNCHAITATYKSLNSNGRKERQWKNKGYRV